MLEKKSVFIFAISNKTLRVNLFIVIFEIVIIKTWIKTTTISWVNVRITWAIKYIGIKSASRYYSWHTQSLLSTPFKHHTHILHVSLKFFCEKNEVLTGPCIVVAKLFAIFHFSSSYLDWRNCKLHWRNQNTFFRTFWTHIHH